ncbi:HEAT repeat domain-containing protein [Streptomyces sp. NPDC056230]|uniref:HEAT repeat domain-containing protein n=1 Tax=Streptomyces sp. NPDC056230 TaxID=3345754 RepID=UPI0035D8E7C7
MIPMRRFEPPQEWNRIPALRQRLADLLTAGRRRTALDEVLRHLRHDPESTDGLFLAIAVLTQGRTERLESDEPQTDVQIWSALLAPVATECSACDASWYSRHAFLLSDGFTELTLRNPAGLQCQKCRYTLCRNCRGEGSQSYAAADDRLGLPDDHPCPSPFCAGTLTTPVLPTGRHDVTPMDPEGIEGVIVARDGFILPTMDEALVPVTRHLPLIADDAPLIHIRRSISGMMGDESTRDELAQSLVRELEHEGVIAAGGWGRSRRIFVLAGDANDTNYLITVVRKGEQRPSPSDPPGAADTRRTIAQVLARMDGRQHKQSIRLNQRLVHMMVMREGPEAISPDHMNRVLQSVAPDYFEDQPSLFGLPVPQWPDHSKDLALALIARDNPEYLTDSYEIQVQDGRDQQGVRWLMAKVFTKTPNIAAPDAARLAADTTLDCASRKEATGAPAIASGETDLVLLADLANDAIGSSLRVEMAKGDSGAGAARRLAALAADTALDGGARVRAAEALAGMDKEAGVFRLATLAADTALDDELRVQAAKALAPMASHAGAVQLAALADNATLGGLARMEAAEALAEVDRQAGAARFAALADDATVYTPYRVRAAMALAGTDKEAGVVRLAALAADPDPYNVYRAQAVRALAEVDRQAGVFRLAALAADTTLNGLSRIEAAEALARMDRQVGALQLAALADNTTLDGEPRVRASAALAGVDGNAGAARLAALADDTTLDTRYRVRAAAALAGVDREAGVFRLAALAADTTLYDFSRMEAAEALARMDGEAGAARLAALASDTTLNDKLRVQAAKALTRLDREAGAARLAALTDDTTLDGQFRVLAAKALASMDKEAGAARLATLTDDTTLDDKLRKQAAKALARIGRKADAARLTTLTDDTTVNSDSRVQAAETLARIDGKADAARLDNLADDTTQPTSWWARVRHGRPGRRQWGS